MVVKASCRTPDFVQGFRSAVLPSFPPCTSHRAQKGFWKGWSMSLNPHPAATPSANYQSIRPLFVLITKISRKELVKGLLISFSFSLG